MGYVLSRIVAMLLRQHLQCLLQLELLLLGRYLLLLLLHSVTIQVLVAFYWMVKEYGRV